ncbi:Oxoglutarate and iron-dependent oxygenase degradation C-term-domain-containing protein [Lentinula raphanica]|uniref:uS12 prolyl 3,4-dihydroxylase n=1 Tax=Lentinula raphanica TaxID=153919 RepID=A0AA38P8G4_9AGAR|nr:Oxoglutarate and iron-dependent oxygenase degradation C-term-domain-containing protein [Lentinula raphanica]
MARTHSRPSSPELSASLLKRIKISHPTLNDKPPADEITAAFASGLLEPSNVAKLHKSYLESEPFRYTRVPKLFQDDLLKKVKDECLGELSFTEKETDIYKVNQTGDLASLNYLDSSQLSLLPNLLKLRDALYSTKFRAFLQAVTGCGPLSGIKQDMSVNSYTKGCHLLNHDDVIGTRRVSYILYMPLPNYQLWQRDWGGALELYPTKLGPEGVPEPECVPSKSVPPSWNQFIFFEVQPGRSFHSVEEVVVGSGGEDGRERLSISGWFHAAQEGEEGYVKPVDEPEYKSSREQLANTQTAFKSYNTSQSTIDKPPLPDAQLSEEDLTFLSEFINPVYLQPRTMQSLASRFVEESSLELHSFLANHIAEALEPRLRELDAQDGLGPERNGKVPPHCSGVDATNPDVVSVDDANPFHLTTPTTPLPLGGTLSANGLIPPTPTIGPLPAASKLPSAWTLKGPPHKWRYCTLLPPSPSAPALSITPISAHPNPSEILRKLQDELFSSQAFRAWLSIVSRLLPLRHFVEARRFRPGLDYTLATSEESEARLDVVLGLTPEVKEEVDNSRRGEPVASAPRGWSAAEWGGWECYMAPHNEEDDPAVYRAGTYKKSDVLAHGNKKTTDTNGANGQLVNGTNGHSVNGTNGHSVNGHTANGVNGENGKTNGHAEVNGNGRHSTTSPLGSPAAANEEDESMEVDDDEEDSTLLTVQPGFNRLLLVLRDERVMRFVKYVSAAAEGSRWDVCAEFEVGMVQEEGDDDDADDDDQ